MAVRRERGKAAFAELDAKLKELEGVEGKSGWTDAEYYEDRGGQETPVAYVAAIQEFGDGKTPPRPFMRPTVATKGREWIAHMGVEAKKVLTQNYPPVEGVRNVADRAAGDIAKAIVAINGPPLSQVTLALRLWKRRNPGTPVTGTIVGEVAAQVKAGKFDFSGLTPTLEKPLVETGLLLRSLKGVADKVK